MSHALKPMTVDDFLSWEAAQPVKWEFDGFAPVAMTGGTAAHAGLQRNLITALTTRLRGTPCLPFGPDLKVVVDPSVRYPDALVTCTPMEPTATVARDPVVLFEIPSPSSRTTDHLTKLHEYRALPSVQRYILVEQDQVMLTVYNRTPAGWIVDQLQQGATLAMPEIDITLPVDELYLDVPLVPLQPTSDMPPQKP